ncbi:CBS domain-containing protein [Thalassiella azotivora]
MLVREAMTAPAVTVRARDTVRDAAVLLLEHRIASAPVLDDDGHLVGVVSEADLLRGRTQRDPRSSIRDTGPDTEPAPAVHVETVMATPPLLVRGDDDVDRAARLLLDHGVKMLPVCEGKDVVGVVARRDLLRSLARPDADVERDVRDLLAELGQADGWDLDVVDGVVTLYGAPDGARQRIAGVLARTVPGVVRVRRRSARPAG